MKKLLYLVLALLVIPKANAAFESQQVNYSQGYVSNLSVQFIPSTTGAVKARFEWKTYGRTDIVTKVTLDQMAGNTATGVSPAGQSCGSGENHCYEFSNLPNTSSAASYRYTINNVPTVTGYTEGEITVDSGATLYPGRLFGLAVAGSDPEEKSIRKGQSATYQFQIANTGNWDDSYSISAEEVSTVISTSLASSTASVKAGSPSNIMTLTVTADSDSSSNQSISGGIIARSNSKADRLITIPFKVIVLAAEAAATPPTSTTSPSNMSPSTVPPTSPVVNTPSVPQNLAVEKVSETGIRLSWNASQTNSTTTSSILYLIYRGGAKIAETTNTFYTDTNLSAGTYSYSVAAQNSSGTSGMSSAVSINLGSASTAPQSQTVQIPGFVLIKGSVRYPDGQPASGAFISAWAENGLRFPAISDGQGSFSMYVTRGHAWHISASKIEASKAYKSDDVITNFSSDKFTDVDLLMKLVSESVPLPTSIQRSVTQEIKAELSNGVRIDIPPAVVTNANNVTLNVAPTAEVREYSQSQVVGFAYEITLTDQSGGSITSLSKTIDITFPYRDEELAALSLNPENLVPSFYDPAKLAWITVPSFTLNKTAKTVTAHVNHLTRFALIGAADITPPQAPIAVTVKKVDSSIVLNWANPKSDFRHTKIYRSTEAGKLGRVAYAEVIGTSKADTTATAGVVYYYTVRSVDPAGNESTNTNQVKYPPLGNTAGASAFKALKKGSFGNDVKLLQKVMAKDGLYQESLATGYFGALTHMAVIKFQEKYKAEILAPVKLNRGTGFVGSSTWKKILELKDKYSL